MWSAYILQTGAVLVFVEVVMLPEAQQVVEVVEQTARVFLSKLLLLKSSQVEWQLAPPPCQHQHYQTCVQAAHILLRLDNKQQILNASITVMYCWGDEGKEKCKVNICSLTYILKMSGTVQGGVIAVLVTTNKSLKKTKVQSCLG